MRKAIQMFTFLLAGLLLLDAILALLSLPSLVSGDELTSDWSGKVTIALLAIGNVGLIAKPRPGGIVFNAAVIAGTISSMRRIDTGVIAWIAISSLITVMSVFDFITDRRIRRIEAIHARIEEEIIDGSLICDKIPSTSASEQHSRI